jgi:pyruvate kinase
VREPADLDVFHEYLRHRASPARVIAKIEDQQAISNLDEIILAADGLMIARGDLGVECPFEDLPVIQTRAIDTCIRQLKPVIVATHMLESMIDSPIPTRAEVTDVANAIREQADCVMLSGETTVGKYPIECVETINRIATRIEEEQTDTLRKDLVLNLPKSKMLRSAANLATEMNAPILCFTRRGIFTQKLSSLRPKVPVYAFTDNPILFKQLLLLHGIEPFFIEFVHELEDNIQSAFNSLRAGGWCKSGDPIVVVTKIYAGKNLIDGTQIREVNGNSS